MIQRSKQPHQSSSARTMSPVDADVPRIAQISAELMKLENYHHGESSSHPKVVTGGIFKQRKQAGGKKLEQQRIYHQFPPSLLAFARMLPGNDSCPDCALRGTKVVNNCLTWANLEFGTLLCEECAFDQIHKRKMPSSIISLLDSNSLYLTQILTILEGGNRKMLEALEHKSGHRHKSSTSPNYEERYNSKESDRYKIFLKENVNKAHKLISENGPGQKSRFNLLKKSSKTGQNVMPTNAVKQNDPFQRARTQLSSVQPKTTTAGMQHFFFGESKTNMGSSTSSRSLSQRMNDCLEPQPELKKQDHRPPLQNKASILSFFTKKQESNSAMKSSNHGDRLPSSGDSVAMFMSRMNEVESSGSDNSRRKRETKDHKLQHYTHARSVQYMDGNHTSFPRNKHPIAAPQEMRQSVKDGDGTKKTVSDRQAPQTRSQRIFMERIEHSSSSSRKTRSSQIRPIDSKRMHPLSMKRGSIDTIDTNGAMVEPPGSLPETTLFHEHNTAKTTVGVIVAAQDPTMANTNRKMEDRSAPTMKRNNYPSASRYQHTNLNAGVARPGLIKKKKTRAENLNIAALTGAIEDLSPVKHPPASNPRKPSIVDAANHRILRHAIDNLKISGDGDVRLPQQPNTNGPVSRQGKVYRAGTPVLMNIEYENDLVYKQQIASRRSVGSMDTLKGGLCGSPRPLIAPNSIVRINNTEPPTSSQPQMTQQNFVPHPQTQMRRSVGGSKRRTHMQMNPGLFKPVETND